MMQISRMFADEIREDPRDPPNPRPNEVLGKKPAKTRGSGLQISNLPTIESTVQHSGNKANLKSVNPTPTFSTRIVSVPAASVAGRDLPRRCSDTYRRFGLP